MYLGRVTGDTRDVMQRIKEHKKDEWYKDGFWKIEWVNLDDYSKTDVNALESHFISLLKPKYNVAQVKWGTSKIFDDFANDIEWTTLDDGTKYLSELSEQNIKLKEQVSQLEKEKNNLEQENSKLQSIAQYYKSTNNEVSERMSELYIKELTLMPKEEGGKKGRPVQMTKQDLRLIQSLREKGRSMREIAKLTGYSVGTIYNWQHRYDPLIGNE